MPETSLRSPYLPVFWVPFVRDFYLWFGGVDVGKKTLQRVLNRKESILVLPGGIKEQLWVCPSGEDVVVLKNRKGFVQLALQVCSTSSQRLF